jgi:excisionase family DNA binding protein
MNTPSSPWGLEPLLSVTELAEYLGIPVATIYEWRSNGTGPVGHRFGKHLKFSVTDIQTWVQNQRDHTTGSPALKGGE